MSGFSVPAFDFLYQGLPASGGSLNVYQTGTTTPVTIYSDGALTIPLSNPLTLDGNGQAKFYISGAVNLRLDAYTATGTLIQSIDPVYPVGSGGSGASGAVPWVAAGGTSDVITATYSPVITTLTDGLLLGFRATAANTTTTPTFSPNALTAHTITQKGGSALTAGNIAAAGAEYLVQYDLANTRWELLNPSNAASGAWTLLTTNTASNSATLDFLANINSTYKNYIFFIDSILPVTNNTELQMLMSSNAGSSWDSTYSRSTISVGSGSPSAGAGGSDAAAVINPMQTLSNNAAGGANGIIELFDPSNSATKTICLFRVTGLINGATSVQFYYGTGMNPTASAINAIRFQMASGNISSGIIKMYGVS